MAESGGPARYRFCYICHARLSDDPNLVHVAVDVDAMEAFGVNDVSELRGDEPILIELCHVCGTREQTPTVQQIKDSEPKVPIQ